MRSIIPRPGMTGWIHHVTGYAIPDGLSDYQKITVIPTTPGIHYAYVTIRDEHGRTHDVHSIHVDAGRKLRIEPPYLDDGQYHHESDPRVIAYFYRQLKIGWRDIPDSSTRAAWIAEMTANYRHILTRNGYDPDHPPADLGDRARAADAAARAPAAAPPALTARQRLRQSYLGQP